MRRAVSTAYYALFHLLISEAALNWKRADQRHSLARLFEHGKMKAASDRQRAECDRLIQSGPPAPQVERLRHLRRVAHTFFKSQPQRHAADYDNSKQWTRTEVLTQIARVDAAFRSWNSIRDEPAAQAYLVSLLGKPLGQG